MIAIGHEDPKQREREEGYALRRILVRKLQQTTRGVTRRTRNTRHHQFVEEWRRYSAGGRLSLVQRALAVGPAVAAEAGPDWRSSLLLSLAAGVQADRCVDRRLDRSLDRSIDRRGRPQACVGENRLREPGPGQVELFGAQLVSQPV